MNEDLNNQGNHEAAKARLKAAVEQDGGAAGIFNLLRSAEHSQATRLRYDGLMNAAASQTDRAFNHIVQTESGRTLEDRINEQLVAVAEAFPDIAIVDLPSMLSFLLKSHRAKPRSKIDRGNWARRVVLYVTVPKFNHFLLHLS
jgi:hypothetical protein